jgi:hypothetical protein
LNQFLLVESLIDQSNVCSRLRRKPALRHATDEEIEFAALRFVELELKELAGLEISVIVLEQIVSSPVLRVGNEVSPPESIISLDI